MHDDLVAIIALWGTDRQTLGLEERLAALEGAITATAARQAEVAAERAALVERQAALRGEEATLSKRLDDATTRKLRTQALIDAGKATDFLVATRQVETAAAAADELETRILEIMEEQEALSQKLADNARSGVLAEARHREALRDREAQAPGLRAEIEALAARRPPQWAALPREEQNRYRNLRKLGLRPLASMVGEVCTGCRMQVPPQMVHEIRHGHRTHLCRGCGRWLVELEEGVEI